MSLYTRIIYTTISLSSLLFLTACSTQYAYHQTEPEIQKIKDFSLDTFIRDKIIDSQTDVNKTILSALNPVSKVLATVSGGKSIHEELEYRKKHFIYQGLFDCRYHALTKPKKDLELFCKAKGGRLQTKSINKTNLALGRVDNSMQNISEAYERMIRMGKQQFYSTEAVNAMSKAIDEESFGEFSCTKENSNIWSVNITPLSVIQRKGLAVDFPYYEIYIAVIPSSLKIIK